MFQYEVLSEQEAMEERFQLVKEGEYDAVISSAKDTISANSGNPMIDLMVTVFDENGKPVGIRDFLVFTRQMMWKVVHFANSAGELPAYEEGALCADIARDKRVRVRVVVEPGNDIPLDKLKGKPLGSKYPDKNKIEDYVKKEDQKPLDHKPNDLDEDVPF